MVKIKKLMFKAVFIPWKNYDFLQSKMVPGLWTKTFLGLIFFGLAFSLTSLAQAATGNFPGIPVILPLSLENYFFWQMILVGPWLVLSWLLVSLFARVLLLSFGARAVSFRQLSASLSLSFYPFLFWLWVPHFITAILYLLGMSQKEWVDLLSEPGWFQTGYIAFIVLATLTGFLAVNITLAKRKWTKIGASLMTASLSFILWCLLVLIFLR